MSVAISKNLQDLNSKTFQVLSSTLSVFKHFLGPWSFYSKFKHFQGFLKHAMNPVHRSELISRKLRLHQSWKQQLKDKNKEKIQYFHRHTDHLAVWKLLSGKSQFRSKSIPFIHCSLQLLPICSLTCIQQSLPTTVPVKPLVTSVCLPVFTLTFEPTELWPSFIASRHAA